MTLSGQFQVLFQDPSRMSYQTRLGGMARQWAWRLDQPNRPEDGTSSPLDGLSVSTRFDTAVAKPRSAVRMSIEISRVPAMFFKTLASRPTSSDGTSALGCSARDRKSVV